MDDALHRLYLASHYEVRLPGGRTRATLRIGSRLPRELDAWLGQAHVGAFITAWNPRSTACPAAQNRIAQHALLAAVRRHGARVLPGVGRLPGQSWREPSLFVAGLDLAQIDALACRHSQNAVVLAHRHGGAVLRGYAGA